MKNSVIQKMVIHIAALLLHLWFSTCRIKIIGNRWHEKYISGRHKVIGATWHRGAIFLVWFFRKAHPMIMFSQSKDGDLIAGFAEKLGIIPIRGSSSRGGRKALKEMLRYLSLPGDRKAATVMDGPRGPRCIAKKGMIILSMMSEIPILPIMVSASRAITFKNTWDRTLLPLPFSRVIVIFSEPIRIPKKIDDAALEMYRSRMEQQLNTMMQKADQMAGYTP